MKIRILHTISTPSGLMQRGKVYEVDAAFGEAVASGRRPSAEIVERGPTGPEEAAEGGPKEAVDPADSVDLLPLDEKTREALAGTGVKTISELRGMEDLTDLPGIGIAYARRISAAIVEFDGTRLPHEAKPRHEATTSPAPRRENTTKASTGERSETDKDEADEGPEPIEEEADETEAETPKKPETVDALDVAPRIVEALQAAGLGTLDDVRTAGDLTLVEDISKADADAIELAFAKLEV